MSSNVLVEFTDEDGTRFAIRKDLIAGILENPDGSIALGIGWPSHTEWRRYEGLQYGDVIDELCRTTKEEK